MLKITKPSSSRLDIELSGALNADAMREGLDTLIAKSEGISNGTMLYTISDFEMPSLGALAVELQQMPKLFSLIRKFDRCAVLSDASWIRTAAEMEGVVVPGLDIKSFPLSSAKMAEKWLASDEETAEDDGDENFPV